MKRIITLVLALIMMFALAACGGGGEAIDLNSIDFSDVPEVPEGKKRTLPWNVRKPLLLDGLR